MAQAEMRIYRTKDKKAPHNAYTSGAKLNKTIGQLGYRTSYSDTYSGHFQFSEETALMSRQNQTQRTRISSIRPMR